MNYTVSAKFTNFALEKKPFSFERLVYKSSLTICVLSMLYLLSVFITGTSWLPFTKSNTDSSELTLSLIQCFLGTAAINIPVFLTKFTHIKIPDILNVMFYIFILCATVLGEMFSLYYAIPVWDSILHFSSGVMAGILGSILLVNFLKAKKCVQLIFPMFIAVTSICFALCIGTVWEIYEFTADSLLDLNMQKCLLQNGTELIGKAAITDTMKDLIVDIFGAIIAAMSSYISLKKKNGWLYSYQSDETSTTSSKSLYEEQAFPRSA